MATFVLVHGAWHGSWCWKRVRKALQAVGQEVFTPTLTGVGERSHLRAPQVNLDTHIDDIVNLTSKARMLIFDQVSTDRVVTALKGSDSSFRELILASLASRTRRLVEHELASGIPAGQREILDARRAITDLALEMAGRGEIELNPDQEDQPVFT